MPGFKVKTSFFFFVELFDFHPGRAEKIQPFGVRVTVAVHHAPDAGLVDELAAFAAGRHGYVEGGSFARLGRGRDLEDGVGLGVEHVPFGLVVFVFARVFKAGRSAVVAVRDDLAVFDDQGPDFLAVAVREFGPDGSHPHVGAVELALFLPVLRGFPGDVSQGAFRFLRLFFRDGRFLWGSRVIPPVGGQVAETLGQQGLPLFGEVEFSVFYQREVWLAHPQKGAESLLGDLMVFSEFFEVDHQYVFLRENYRRVKGKVRMSKGIISPMAIEESTRM